MYQYLGLEIYFSWTKYLRSRIDYNMKLDPKFTGKKCQEYVSKPCDLLTMFSNNYINVYWAVFDSDISTYTT